MCQLPFSKLKNGTYLAKVSHETNSRRIVFRWEKTHRGSEGQHLYSADFFEDEKMVVSIRGKLDSKDLPCGELSAQQFQHVEEEAIQNMIINVHAITESTLSLSCQMGEGKAAFWEYTLDYQGPHYRKMLVRMIRMENLRLPDPLKLHEFPERVQPPIDDEEAFETSLEHLFSRMDIQLDVEFYHLDEAILPFDMEAYRRCPEKILWDEKALHQLMVEQFPEIDDQPDWIANLLLLRGFYGTYGEYDFGGHESFRKTVGVMFDRQTGYQMAGPGIARFYNAKPRQGAAIFWDPLVRKARRKEDWYLQREFAFLMVHEIGHILNLRHAPTCEELTYMNYPDRYCGGREEFWEQFGFVFTEKERAHLNHGFLPEVLPGGQVGFPLIQTATLVGSDLNAPDASLFIQMTKPVYAYQEPVAIEINYTNKTRVARPAPPLDPSYGDVQIHVVGPDGKTKIFQPPVVKCMVDKTILKPRKSISYTALLSIDNMGFWLEEPGMYLVKASASPVVAGEPVFEAFTTFFRQEPVNGDAIRHPIFSNTDAAHFLYFKGTNLGAAKGHWLQFVRDHPEHPICGLAHLALALQELPICHRTPQPKIHLSLTPTTKKHLVNAIEYGELPLSNRRALIQLFDAEISQSQTGHIRPRAGMWSWFKKFKHLFKKPKIKAFIGVHHLKIQIGGQRSKSLDAKLTIQQDLSAEDRPITYRLQFPDRPHHDHEGTAEFDQGKRFQDPIMFLRGTSMETSNQFDLAMRFAVRIFSRKLYISGRLISGSSGGNTSTVVTGTSPDPDSNGTNPGNPGG